MATDMYLKIEGIDGDSTDDKHKKWIEIEEATFGVKQTSAGGSSAHGSHLAGRADFEAFRCLKHLDASTPLINLYCSNGKHVPKIEVEFCRPMGDKTTYMKYVMKDCAISSIVTQAASGDDAVPKDEIYIRFSELHWIYTPTDPTGGGKKGSDVKKGWSTRENKEVTP